MDLGRADGLPRMGAVRPRRRRRGDRAAKARRRRASQSILHRARRSRRGIGARSLRTRGRRRFVRLEPVWPARSCARTEPVSDSRAIHGAREPRAGRAHRSGAGGDASALRSSGACRLGGGDGAAPR